MSVINLGGSVEYPRGVLSVPDTTHQKKLIQIIIQIRLQFNQPVGNTFEPNPTLLQHLDVKGS